MPSIGLDYPRLLNLDDDTLEDLKIRLDDILSRHYAERGTFDDDLLRFQKAYWAEPSTEIKKFPFEGAANIIIPLTAIAVEATHAAVMQRLFSQTQQVSATPLSNTWSEAKDDIERYLNWELEEPRIDFRGQLESSILEIEKLGTGCAKMGFQKIQKWAVQEINGEEVEFPVTVKRGATVEPVPISRFLMPFSNLDIQTAEWCGQQVEMNPYEVKIHEDSGLFDEGTSDALDAWVTQISDNSSDAYKRQQEILENRQPFLPSRLMFEEIWIPFDVDKTGRMKEIVVWYHREARHVAAIRYNWNHKLRRPFEKGVYFKIEHRWTGIGIAKMNDAFQLEVTTQHRQRLDNASLANMRGFKVSRLAGVRPDEPIFPGKIWFMDDISQLESVQLGEIYPSAYNNENMVVMYSQQRTGVNDITLGMPNVGTPGTATDALTRVQESQKRFDYTYRNITNFADRCLQGLALNIWQFGASDLRYFAEVDGGPLVEQILNLPGDSITSGLVMKISNASDRENRILDRQNWLQITQMLTQYYTQIMLLIQQGGDQEMIKIVSAKAIIAATEAMKQILESFDIRNIDRIILEDLSKKLSKLGNSNGNQPNAGRSSIPAGDQRFITA